MLENFRANVFNALYFQASRIESGKKRYATETLTRSVPGNTA